MKEPLCRFIECEVCRIYNGTALYRKEYFNRHLNSKGHKLNAELKTVSDKFNNEKDEKKRDILFSELEKISERQMKTRKSKSLDINRDLTEKERDEYLKKRQSEQELSFLNEHSRIKEREENKDSAQEKLNDNFKNFVHKQFNNEMIKDGKEVVPIEAFDGIKFIARYESQNLH